MWNKVEGIDIRLFLCGEGGSYYHTAKEVAGSFDLPSVSEVPEGVIWAEYKRHEAGYALLSEAHIFLTL